MQAKGSRSFRQWYLTVLCLAGCAGGPAILDEADWTFEPLPGGARLTAVDAAGPVLQMSCNNADGIVVVRAFRLNPITGDLPLVFGTADQAMAFTVDRAAAGPGVVASRDGAYTLLISLLSEGAVSAVYGEQTVGPVILPGNEADAFAGACIEPV